MGTKLSLGWFYLNVVALLTIKNKRRKSTKHSAYDWDNAVSQLLSENTWKKKHYLIILNACKKNVIVIVP